MRILLIDDNDKFRRELQAWLTDTLKHSVAVASSIDAAHEQLGNDRYHVILLDGRLRNHETDQVDSNSEGGLTVMSMMSPSKIRKTIWMTAHDLDDVSEPVLRGCNRLVFKRWIDPQTQPADEFHRKLEGHLARIAARQWGTFTTILCCLAVVVTGASVVWQIFQHFTPVLLGALIGITMNVISFVAFLTGVPPHRLCRR